MTNYNPSHVVLNAIYALKQNIDICSRIYIVVTYLKQKYLIKLSTDVIFKKKKKSFFPEATHVYDRR